MTTFSKYICSEEHRLSISKNNEIDTKVSKEILEHKENKRVAEDIIEDSKKMYAVSLVALGLFGTILMSAAEWNRIAAGMCLVMMYITIRTYLNGMFQKAALISELEQLNIKWKNTKKQLDLKKIEAASMEAFMKKEVI